MSTPREPALKELRRDIVAAGFMLAAVVAGTALVHLFL
jgi:hypothetical protein